MTQQHPITPPPHLIDRWIKDHSSLIDQWIKDHSSLYALSRSAAQWGADQEMEACIAWMKRAGYWAPDGMAAPALRAARRPKPPSLKEQALAQLDLMTQKAYARNFAGFQDDAIRRALEQLPDNE